MSQTVAPTRAQFKTLKECQTLGQAFECGEFLDRIRQSAPAHVKPARMLRTFIQATSRAPLLLKCNMRSVLGAMLTCSEVGLEPNTPLQHAFLIPFAKSKWNPGTRTREIVDYEVQLIFGYPGLLDLAYRSGHVVSVHADVVWPSEAKDKDRWSFSYGTDSHLRHVPTGDHEANERPVWAYAHANLTHGQAFEAIPWAEIMRIRNGSQGFQSALRAKETGEKAAKPYVPSSWTEAPWVKHEIAMARKTAFRSLSKWLPKSVELAGALALDEQQDRSTVDFGAVIDGSASILDSGFTENEDTGDGGEHDSAGAAFTDRRPSQQRDADQLNAASTQQAQATSEAQAPAQTKPAETKPTPPAASQAPAFAEYIIDEEGQVISGPFNDPAGFIAAYEIAEQDAFPGTLEMFTRANADSLSKARSLLPKKQEEKQKAPGSDNPPSGLFGADEPASNPLMVPRPQRVTKGTAEQYNAAIGKLLADATTPDEINAIEDANAATIEGFPPSQRLAVKGIIADRQKAISPPPPRETTRPAHEIAAEGIERDINAQTSEADLSAFLALPTVGAAIDNIATAAPPLHERLITLIQTKRAALKPPAEEAQPEPADEPQPDAPVEKTWTEKADDLIRQIEACPTLDAMTALNAQVDVLKLTKDMWTQSKPDYERVKTAALTKRSALAG